MTNLPLYDAAERGPRRLEEEMLEVLRRVATGHQADGIAGGGEGVRVEIPSLSG